MTQHAIYPPRKRRIWPFVLIALALAFCVGSSIWAFVSVNDPDTATLGVAATTGAQAPAAKTTTPAAKARFTKDQVALTVKTTKKDCFGSAGCNVIYTVKVATKGGVAIPDECEITYEVRGLEDPQLGTLVLTSDGHYTQDDFQAGQTRRSSSKLTAKVTDMECS